MGLVRVELKEAVVKVLDELPSERIAEVLYFAVFMKERAGEEKRISRIPLKSMPANHLKYLVGLVAWGGDALEDAERLYDGDD
ncbi:MAG: hypothetical protein KKD28_04180 [Chloroflexi bacterium]|nr:hypothetical protein [Chloroflexota bacterium]MBU1660651.1 hypothetical protein [Chloroflexota bacterium]